MSDQVEIVDKARTLGDISRLNSEGEKLIRYQKYKEAKQTFNKVLEIDRENVNAYINLGRIHQAKDQHLRAFMKLVKAETLYKKEIENYERREENNQSPLVLKKLSGMYLKMGTIYFLQEKYKPAMKARLRAKELLEQARTPPR